MGPVKQCQKMWAETRWLTTAVAIGFLFLTLFAALKLKNPPLAIICVICQFTAMTWYSLSYIPYARNMVRSFLGNCFGGIL